MSVQGPIDTTAAREAVRPLVDTWQLDEPEHLRREQRDFFPELLLGVSHEEARKVVRLIADGQIGFDRLKGADVQDTVHIRDGIVIGERTVRDVYVPQNRAEMIALLTDTVVEDVDRLGGVDEELER